MTATFEFFFNCDVLPFGKIEKGSYLHPNENRPDFSGEKQHVVEISSIANDGSSGSLGNIPLSFSEENSPAMEESEEHKKTADEDFWRAARFAHNNYRAENERYRLPVSKTMTKVS